MKVKYLDGEVTNWIIKGDIVSAGEKRSKRSKLHVQAREIIYSLFPTMRILEEVSFSPKRGTTQYFDFYISNIQLVVEVHGQQHYKFNSLFHGSVRDFLMQKKKDNEKKEWCEINGITYIELPYNEKVEEWQKRIELR